MRYWLSHLFPVHFSTMYAEHATGRLFTARWWQWRDRCFRAHHTATGSIVRLP